MARKAAKAKQPKAAKDRQFVTALARGLRILTCFGTARRELGSREIGRMLGLAEPTVRRLCYTMAQEGYLHQSPVTGKLRPSLALLKLGHEALAREAPVDLVAPDLEALSTRLGASVAITARDDLDMVYVLRARDSGSPFVEARQPGSRVPILETPGGWAYMAALTPTERQRLLATIKDRNRASWQRHHAALAAAITTYDRDGYMPYAGVLLKEWNAIAIPIQTASGAILGLSVGGLASDLPVTRFKALGLDMRAFAEKIAPAFAHASVTESVTAKHRIRAA